MLIFAFLAQLELLSAFIIFLNSSFIIFLSLIEMWISTVSNLTSFFKSSKKPSSSLSNKLIAPYLQAFFAVRAAYAF